MTQRIIDKARVILAKLVDAADQKQKKGVDWHTPNFTPDDWARSRFIEVLEAKEEAREKEIEKLERQLKDSITEEQRGLYDRYLLALNESERFLTHDACMDAWKNFEASLSAQQREVYDQIWKLTREGGEDNTLRWIDFGLDDSKIVLSVTRPLNFTEVEAMAVCDIFKEALNTACEGDESLDIPDSFVLINNRKDLKFDLLKRSDKKLNLEELGCIIDCLLLTLKAPENWRKVNTLGGVGYLREIDASVIDDLVFNVTSHFILDKMSCSPKIEPVYKVQSLTERGQFYDWDEEAA